jgi:7,8-dihydroneopterin aldolase/epimerase/oxygenase
MDRIEIRELRVFGHHGVLPAEQRDGQTFVIDATLWVDLAAAARSDALADTVHYGVLAERIAEAVTQTRFDLLEALAGHLTDLCLADAAVREVEIRVAKPAAPIDLDLREVAVVLRRSR